MEYTVLGKTGRRVSRIGFGGAPAGLKNYLHSYDPSESKARDQVIQAIHRALELGINYFDTAQGYGSGTGEEIYGEALLGADPESIFLATKVGPWSEETVRESLEKSLSRLRRDRIDLLQIHGTHYTPEAAGKVLRKGGMLDQLQQCREEGLISHLGFTCEAINRPVLDFLDTEQFDVIQTLYNFLFQHPYDPGWKSGLLYEVEERGMGITVMRTTTSGIFQKWIRKVDPENQRDYTPDLIQFQLSNPLVDVALIGMRNPQRVEQNVAILEDTSRRIDLAELFNRYEK